VGWGEGKIFGKLSLKRRRRGQLSDSIIDIHVHFGAPDDQASGCYWSKKFTKSLAFIVMLILTNFLFKKVNISRIKKRMFKIVRRSKCVDQFVFLALDQVYDKSGNVHKEQTHLYVPNDYLASLAKQNNRVLFGASVHPYRPDWKKELLYCLQNRAVLCKWLPSAQMIDPSDDRCRNMYNVLAEHKLPLLCHVGPEYACPSAAPNLERLNDPNLLVNALEARVVVIMAHCAMPYFGPWDNHIYRQYFQSFLDLMNKANDKGWNLYADLSAICIPTREAYVSRVINQVPPERLLFGSDYPVLLTEFCYYKRGQSFWDRVRFIRKMARVRNLLDMNYYIIEEMGFNPCVFTNASKLFANIKYPLPS
jgi:predicted TIM-barrel fold metal-dependent hydrolase